MAEDSTANAINVLANDTDPDTGTTLTITAVTQPTNGTVVITGDGTGLTYTPAANFTGPDTFTYTITDGASAPTPPPCRSPSPRSTTPRSPSMTPSPPTKTPR